jgi:plastocyanin
MTRTRTGVAVIALGALTGLLAGCGGSTDAPAAQGSSAGAASSGSSSAPGRTLRVTITGRTVTPAPSQVDVKPGQTLTLVVTSDHDDELHAHGFEVEKELKAGVPTTLVLRTDLPGVYEVETHHPPLRLLSVAVQ